MARRSTSKPTDSAVASLPFGSSISRSEWIAIIVLVVLAAALRFAYPSRMAIEHFDEGVYASNIFFSEAEGGQYPYRHLYAPPLLPFLIEWGIIFLGPESIAPFLPALILGTATVPLAWWAVRCWFGPLAGLAAAMLIATSDFHVLYSRTALTDVPVAFFMLLAVYLYWDAIRRESFRWSIAAGVATGLAWWTKYTGWLPLAIALAGSIAWLLTERRAWGVTPRVRIKNVAALFATTALVAFLVWSPVLWYLQPYGGYAAVAENHRGYLQSELDWGSNAVEQANQLAFQSGNMTVLSVAALGFLVPLFSNRSTLETTAWEVWCLATIGWSVLELGPAWPLAVIALGGLATKIASIFLSTSFTTNRFGSVSPLALWLLAAWFCGTLVTTPFYTPYSRLALPWLIAAILGAAVWFWNVRDIDPRPLFRVRSVYLFAAAVLLVLPPGVYLARNHEQNSWHRYLKLTSERAMPAWQDRSGLSELAEHIARRIHDERKDSRDACLVQVYQSVSGPAMFFHLASLLSSEHVAVVPGGDLSSLLKPMTNVDMMVVTDARSLSRWRQRFSTAQAETFDREVQLVQTLESQIQMPSTIVSLDGNPFSVRDLAPVIAKRTAGK